VDDITALILDDHHAFRTGFARLDDAHDDPQQLAALWAALSLHLEIHAEAEEQILYPHLLHQAGEEAEEETDDAIRDHNKIRDGIDAAREHQVGSPAWWKSVDETRRENSEHLTEEEDDVLPDFRRHASDELRTALGAQWLRFYADHPSGVGLRFRNKDPEHYIAAHQE